MKILQLHNRYRQAGGEDVVAQAERELLMERGHEVDLLEADNARIMGFSRRMKVAVGTIYSWESKRQVASRIADFRPDLVHVHNFFPLLSPSVYYACQEARVPVVQTLHNPRLMCPAATLCRRDRPCEDCVGRRFAWPGVFHGCYRGSRLQTSAVAVMLAAHHLQGTWKNRVTAYIASTQFFRHKFIQAGLPAEKIEVKPHFVPDGWWPKEGVGDYAIFVGRLSVEKGIRTLMRAWGQLRTRVPLKIRGDGDLARDLMAFARQRGQDVDLVPRLSRHELAEMIAGARFLVWPSQGYYETFGLVAIEAFACGVPVIASGHGAMGEVIEHGRTGLHFRPGDAEDLAAKVEWAVAHPEEMAQMRREARAEYEAKYTPERNYALLMEIYRRVADVKNAAKQELSHAEVAR